MASFLKEFDKMISDDKKQLDREKKEYHAARDSDANEKRLDKIRSKYGPEAVSKVSDEYKNLSHKTFSEGREGVIERKGAKIAKKIEKLNAKLKSRADKMGD